MYRNREKTHYYVIAALAVFIAASASAGPTFYSGSENKAPRSSFGSDSFRGDGGSSWSRRNDGPQFPSNDWQFPTGGEFDRRPHRRGDWDENPQFPDRDWNSREHCGDWDRPVAVPAPGAILLASAGLSMVGLIRKRTIG